MARNESVGGRFFDLYTRYVGEPRSRKDVYGYWTLVVGYLVGFAGVGVFLAGPDGDLLVREVAITLAAAGLPLGLLGIVLLLPVQRRSIQVSIAGAAVAALAVVWFVGAYPSNWGFGQPDYRSVIIATYAIGIAAVGGVAALVPVATGERSLLFESPGARGGDGPAVWIGEAARGALFAVYDDGSRWAWRLIEESALGTAVDSFPSRLDVEEVVERVRKTVEEASLLEIKNAAFRLYDTNEGAVRWLLMREDGIAVAEGAEAYPSRETAEWSVSYLKERGRDADLVEIDEAAFDVFDDSTGWRWRLIDADHAELARSVSYPDRASAEAALNAAQSEVAAAGVLTIDTLGVELFDDGGWRWRLVDGDDERLATGIGSWPSRRAAEEAVYEVLERARSAAVVEADQPGYEAIEEDDGTWRWRFVDDDGRIVARSHVQAIDCARAEADAELVRDGLATADVVPHDGAAFERYPAGEGWRWRLVDADRTVIASGAATAPDPESASEAIGRLRGQAAEAELIECENAAFQLYAADGEWRWRLIDADGNVMTDSGENYASRDAAASAMTTIKHNAPDADLIEIDTAAFELYEGEGGAWNWRLVDETGREVADGGPFYPSREAARAAMDRLVELAGAAEDRLVDRPTFQLYPDGDGWRWRLVHPDGTVLVEAAEGFATRDEAGTAVADFRDGGADAPVHAFGRLAMRIGPAGQGWRWELIDTDRDPVAESDDTYDTRKAVLDAVGAVQAGLDDATVFDIENAAFRLTEDEGEWAWELIDEDRSRLASGAAAFESREAAEQSLDRVRSLAPRVDLLRFEGAAYERYQEDGAWRWRLIDDGYAVVAVGTTTSASPEEVVDEVDGVRSLLDDASILEIDTAAFELHEDGGAWRWRLIDEDGNALGESAVSYSTREAARDAVGTVKEFAPAATTSVAE